MDKRDVTPNLPPGELLYAVGDIHGRADLLDKLLDQIDDDARASHARKRTLVFLGDYVDRGPDSCGVVEKLIADLPQGFARHFLKGNHEALLLGFLDDPETLDLWLMNGGAATMASYGVDIKGLDRFNASPEAWRDAFAASLPESHRKFFAQLELSFADGDYLFVHAGVHPDRPLEAQLEADLIWIRAPFLDWTGPFGKMVVHGHTPVRAPEIRLNRIGIDTGACFTDRLTALKLEGDKRTFLQT
jgi:serine/threonine protein phosphatase 1